MSKHIRLVSLLAVAFALVMLITGPSSAKVLRWKMTTSWPAGIPLYTDMAELYAQNVEHLQTSLKQGVERGYRRILQFPSWAVYLLTQRFAKTLTKAYLS